MKLTLTVREPVENVVLSFSCNCSLSRTDWCQVGLGEGSDS